MPAIPPLALRAAKQSLRLSQEVSLQAGLQQERQLFSLLSATEDRREGIDAFLQKRTPEFKRTLIVEAFYSQRSGTGRHDHYPQSPGPPQQF
ncbi:enoyl-CoA hydratase-related protein [Klebsiella pneumoniae subsp. pneumoniae]|nr:enoyl-CoA hydratase-related protein [Klebsiella pneumoniae subsp. pneumoniae]